MKTILQPIKIGQTDQLRRTHHIHIYRLETQVMNSMYIVTAYGQNRCGRVDASIGCTHIGTKTGEALVEAIRQATDWAKYQVTLALCDEQQPTKADAETASVSEAADANTGSQASNSVDKTGAETASLSQASDGNSDADIVSATTEEEGQESAHDADNASIESPDTDENSVDWNSFSEGLLQDMTSSESSVDEDGSGTSNIASNISGGDNTSNGASSSSSNVNEDDGSSSNGSNGTSDNTSSFGSNTTGGDNTSSAYGDDNGSSYANDVASVTESASTNEATEEVGEDPTAEENVANLATKNIGSNPARSGFLSMLAVSIVAFFAVVLSTILKNNKKEAAAAGGGDGGNSDPLDDDSSIWSANEDIGDMAGP